MQSIIIKNKNVRFESGRPELLQPGAASAAAAQDAHADGPASCEKSVRLVQSDGLVHAIELACSCGEVTLIELDYAEPEPAEPSSPSPEVS